MMLVTAVLAVVLGLAGWLVYARTTGALDAELRSRIREDFALMQDAHARAGEQGLEQFISWAMATRSGDDFAFGMFTPVGVHLSGNVDDMPRFEGWGQIAVRAGEPGQANTMLGYAGQIGDHMVVVAHSSGIVWATGTTVLEALVIAGLAQTLGSVAGGNSDVRLPVSPRNDQIDFVSRQINGYLDRLAELMAGMRNTAIAIAHDLKSPLNRVSILLQTAEAAQDADEIRLHLDKVHHELDGLKGVLDTILRISRIEASDDMSAFAPVDLPALLRDLVQTFEPVFEEQGQTISFIEPGTPVPHALGDRRMLQQLVVNLIENAGRHAGAGAIVAISVAEAAGAPVVTIADNGPGIPADQREAVFEPFYRMNPERDELGTGLGLAMVRAIANRHRATILLGDNNPGLVVRLRLVPQGTGEAVGS